MRSHGTCVELVWLRPHDHIGWVFDDAEEFASVAEPFLKEGLELGERLLFVAGDPTLEPYASLASSFDPAILEVASIADVYGQSGFVDAYGQRNTFATVLAQALADGYNGIRVAADNSALVQTPERLKSWIRWELVADRFMAENPVTGLCGFDRTAVNVDTLRHLVTLHPLSSASEPMPQFRLFVDNSTGLQMQGDVDTFAMQQLRLALDVVPEGTPLAVNLNDARMRGPAANDELQRLVDDGVVVTVGGGRWFPTG